MLKTREKGKNVVEKFISVPILKGLLGNEIFDLNNFEKCRTVKTFADVLIISTFEVISKIWFFHATSRIATAVFILHLRFENLAEV